MSYKIPQTIFKRLLLQNLADNNIHLPVQQKALQLLQEHFEAYLTHIIQLALQNAQRNRNTGNVTAKDIKTAYSIFMNQ